MKYITFIIALLVTGTSSIASPKITNDFEGSFIYGEPFIFVERDVEFAVYPDGQFDFFYNPRGFHVNRISPHVNISYNAGFNYDPFVQYDDYGAVIQIENVPIYYDYYGRIIQAGRVQISYNHLGRISRIGNLHVHYNHYNQFTHYSGFINRYNPRFISRPWHRYYMPPQVHHVVVYNQPYRAHYYPNRVKYSYYRNYYEKHYYNNDGFQRSYYRPGENAVVYHRGRRTEDVRDLKRSDLVTDYAPRKTRSASISRRNDDRANTSTTNRLKMADDSFEETRTSRTPVTRRSTSTGTESNAVNTNSSIRSERTNTIQNSQPIQQKRINTPVRSTPSAVETRQPVQQTRVSTPVRRVSPNTGSRVQSSQVESRQSSSNVRRSATPTVQRAQTIERSSSTPATSNDRTSTSRSTRGRG